MKKALAIIGVVAFCVGAILAALVLSTTPAYGGHNSDVAVLKVTGGGGHGSGVYIGNGSLITAAHVAKESTDFLITNYLGHETHAHVVWFDEATDVALLKLNTPFAEGLQAKEPAISGGLF